MYAGVCMFKSGGGGGLCRENISYLPLKCSPTTSYLGFICQALNRAIHPYHPATKAGSGEEVSVVEGLGCIIGRLFSLLAIE